MFQDFFFKLKSKNIPVSTTELIDLLKVINFHSSNEGSMTLKQLYFIGRSCLVKDIKYYDDYDIIFAGTFGNLNLQEEELKSLMAEWLKMAVENQISEDQKMKAMNLSSDEVFSELEKKIQ